VSCLIESDALGHACAVFTPQVPIDFHRQRAAVGMPQPAGYGVR
jgi:hypothetical protein